jgi:hypothetical protein
VTGDTGIKLVMTDYQTGYYQLAEYYDTLYIFVHEENDFADATVVQEHYATDFLKPSILTMKTKHFSKESTKSMPCHEYWPKACHNKMVQKKILKDYQCKMPIFYNGASSTKDSPICSNDKILAILFRNFSQSRRCSQSVPCEYTKYEAKQWVNVEFSFLGDNPSKIEIIFNGPIMEEHYISSISIDDQTLIGQVGGLLGILLGWSGMTLLEIINPLFERVFAPILSSE